MCYCDSIHWIIHKSTNCSWRLEAVVGIIFQAELMFQSTRKIHQRNKAASVSCSPFFYLQSNLDSFFGKSCFELPLWMPCCNFQQSFTVLIDAPKPSVSVENDVLHVIPKETVTAFECATFHLTVNKAS